MEKTLGQICLSFLRKALQCANFLTLRSNKKLNVFKNLIRCLAAAFGSRFAILKLQMFRSIHFALLTFTMGSLLQACMNQVGGGSYPIQELERVRLTESQKLFGDTLFPLLTLNCSECHSAIQAPIFAVPGNIVLSHDNTLAADLINLDDLSLSIMVTKVRDGHNCWSPSCDEDADALLEAIELWGEVLEGGTILPDLITDEVVIPSSTQGQSICSETVGELLSFDLRQVDPSLPDPSQLQIRIAYNSEAFYELCDPQINSSAAIQIKEMKIYLNNQNNPVNSLYDRMDQTTPSFPTPQITNLHAPAGPVFSPGSVLVPVVAGPGVDRLRFAFEILQPAP